MKKRLLIILMSLSLFLTGCFKKDDLEDITIYTTVYPIEYITTMLYGEHSTIYNIYPNGVNPNTYELTNKQIKDYSKSNMYIFNGFSNEKDLVQKMFKYNKNLMIIDATQTMEYTYSVEELWLDPSNFLMMALNVKNGLNEYIENHYLKNEIEENYKNLKVQISNIDAKLKLLSENSTNKTIVVDKNLFKYLEKYGFTVISLEEGDTLTDKVINDVKKLIDEGVIQYIFTTDENKINNTVKKIVNETDVSLLTLDTISNLNEKQRQSKEDYISILNENIEQLKNELYD